MILKGKVNYVGVNDRYKTLFEGLWPLPYGVTYNSYLIDDEKVALLDTVEISFFPSYIKKLQSILGTRPIDYIIINHMEPDHSGAISLIRKYYPEVTLVGNKKTIEMLKGFYGEAGNTLIVTDGTKLSLGHHQLSFHITPMIHWPETMMTFDTTEGILFSGDAFGCFGALNGAVIDTKIDISPYWSEMRRYYSNIVGKYGAPVQKALHKLAGLDLKMICSTHGPVWEQQIPEVIAEYNRMSLHETDLGVVLAYGTMYGNTEAMAETIAEELAAQGIKNIKMYNVATCHHSYILSDIFHYRALIVGCPTYNNQLFPEMEALLNKVAARDVKNHLFASFGSFSWASAIDRLMTKWAEHLDFEVVSAPVENKQGVTAEVLDSCRALGRAVAETLNQKYTVDSSNGRSSSEETAALTRSETIVTESSE
ncbi:MAG: FprA family A-type flavoprotein [Bacteroidaceae bacterium]